MISPAASSSVCFSLVRFAPQRNCCSSESEASAKTLSFLIDKINEEQIPVVFHTELSNEKMTDCICEATGAKKLLLHSCHNVSKDDFENGATYLSLMEQNVAALKEALN